MHTERDPLRYVIIIIDNSNDKFRLFILIFRFSVATAAEVRSVSVGQREKWLLIFLLFPADADCDLASLSCDSRCVSLFGAV